MTFRLSNIDCSKSFWRKFVLVLAIFWSLGSTLVAYGQCCRPAFQSNSSEHQSTQILHDNSRGHEDSFFRGVPDHGGYNHQDSQAHKNKCVEAKFPGSPLFIVQSSNAFKKNNDKDFDTTTTLDQGVPEFSSLSESPHRVSILSPPEILYLRYQRFIE
jgi:hypothetical protein